MSEIVSVLLLAIHLLLLNLAMAGPLAGVLLDWYAGRQVRPELSAVARRLVGASLQAALAGVVLGAVLLVWAWAGQGTRYVTTLGMLPNARLWFGGAELAIYLLLIALYGRSWRRAGARRLWLWRLLAVAAATNLAYHFPSMFTIVAGLSHDPSLPVALDRGAYHRLLLQPEVLTKMLHIWLAAVAMTALAAMTLLARVADSATGRAHAYRVAARTALGATLLQPVVGVLVLASLDTPQSRRLLGDSFLPTAALATGVLLSFGLIQNLVTLCGGPTRGRLRHAWMLFLLIVVAMTVVLRDRRGGFATPTRESTTAAPIAELPAAQPRLSDRSEPTMAEPAAVTRLETP